MIKTLLTVAVLGSVGGFATLAVAQGKQGEAIGSDVSLRAKLEAQCAHRRIMPPDPRDDCARQLRDAQVGYGGGGRPATPVTAKPLVPDLEMAPDLGMGSDLEMGAGMGRAVGKAVADRRCPSVQKFWTAQGYVSLRVHL